MTKPSLVDVVAHRLDQATRTATTAAQPSLTTPMTLGEAYEVQHAGVSLRAARGDKQVGVKLGFTSEAKAKQMGVADVIAGVVTRSMQIVDGGTLDVDRLIHARIEPEIAFRLDEAIDPNDESDPVAAVGAIAPALEVIDSRYADFRFSLEDVIADNTSAARFVVGPWTPFVGLRDAAGLADLDVSLAVEGVVASTGSSGAILGHPLRAIETVKRLARTHGFKLPRGTILLAGAATEAVPLPTTPGAVVAAEVSGLGSVSVRIGKGES